MTIFLFLYLRDFFFSSCAFGHKNNTNMVGHIVKNRAKTTQWCRIKSMRMESREVEKQSKVVAFSHSQLMLNAPAQRTKMENNDSLACILIWWLVAVGCSASLRIINLDSITILFGTVTVYRTRSSPSAHIKQTEIVAKKRDIGKTRAHPIWKTTEKKN